MNKKNWKILKNNIREIMNRADLPEKPRDITDPTSIDDDFDDVLDGDDPSKTPYNPIFFIGYDQEGHMHYADLKTTAKTKKPSKWVHSRWPQKFQFLGSLN